LPQSAPRPPPPPPPVILDLSNEVSARARTSNKVAHPPEDNSLPLRLTAAGLPGPYRASWDAVVVVLVDHLRERQEETQPANRRARTSCRCLAAPRPACETIRLMGFWSMRALRSAWFGRRRTHLLAKHGTVVVLQDARRTRTMTVGVVRTTGRSRSLHQSGGGDGPDDLLAPWEVPAPASWWSP
jgi:hypothetical protein